MTSDNKNYKILCIEDEVDVRDNITEILKDEGFQVIEANDGVEGYEKFIEENPHVIISDIMMPKMSGYELLKKIRSTKRKDCNNNVPFIFLSALSQREDIIKGTNLSANDYMIKPVDLDILVAKVKEKIRTFNSIEKNYKDNLDNLCLQVSSILSNDMEKQVDTLLKIASILKTRPYGPFGHRKYDDIVDKIYMIAVKLESVVKNSVQPDLIVDKINIEENIIDPEKFVNNLISSATKNINRKITLISSQSDVPNIKINSQILRNVLESLLVKMLKVTNVKEDLKFDLFVDYNGKLAFAIHGNLRDDVKKEFIENTLNIEMEIKELEKQNGLIEKEIKNNKAIMLVNLPGYRFVKK